MTEEVETLKCESCGAPYNPLQRRCEYCGSYFKTEEANHYEEIILDGCYTTSCLPLYFKIDKMNY